MKKNNFWLIPKASDILQKERSVCPTVFSDVERMLWRVQCIVQVRRENSSRISISLTKQNRQCFNSIRHSPPGDREQRNSKNRRSVRHHRARSVFPHSEEPKNSSRSTACRLSTAQTTRRDVSKLIIHMKKLLDSDWLRAVQFKCNTSAKSVTPVQKV